jgi:hypothetical protein
MQSRHHLTDSVMSSGCEQHPGLWMHQQISCLKSRVPQQGLLSYIYGKGRYCWVAGMLHTVSSSISGRFAGIGCRSLCKWNGAQ